MESKNQKTIFEIAAKIAAFCDEVDKDYIVTMSESNSIKQTKE